MAHSDLPGYLPTGVRLRPMRAADIAAGVALCRASGWNQTEGEWALFLELTPGGVVVAEDDGNVVGTAVTLPYAPRIGWVAMVLVDPAHRGRGIGRTLLTHAISNVPAGYALRLDATPAGRMLYATLGFVDEFGLARWRRLRVVPTRPAAPVMPLEGHDWTGIAALDRRVFGADRRAVLEWCWRGAPEYAWVLRGPDGVEGFVLGRHGHDSEHIGPVVSSTAAGACDLVAACVSRARRPAMSIDVPDARVELREWLHSVGFGIERPFTRMCRGALEERGLSEHVFAVTGPEFG